MGHPGRPSTYTYRKACIGPYLGSYVGSPILQCAIFSPHFRALVCSMRYLEQQGGLSEETAKQLYMQAQQQAWHLHNEESMARPSHAVSNWSLLVNHSLKHSRRLWKAQYQHLCVCEFDVDMWQQEEYRIAYLFLTDSTWIPIFPSLARRCTHTLARATLLCLNLNERTGMAASSTSGYPHAF